MLLVLLLPRITSPVTLTREADVAERARTFRVDLPRDATLRVDGTALADRATTPRGALALVLAVLVFVRDAILRVATPREELFVAAALLVGRAAVVALLRGLARPDVRPDCVF